MLSIDECRKILEVTPEQFTDDEITVVRDYLYMIAEIEIEFIQNLTNEERTDLLKGKH
jgi:ribonucleotide reductase beta subunit family protein with ferritin-like domain